MSNVSVVWGPGAGRELDREEGWFEDVKVSEEEGMVRLYRGDDLVAKFSLDDVRVFLVN
jgi:hypothetical protein